MTQGLASPAAVHEVQGWTIMESALVYRQNPCTGASSNVEFPDDAQTALEVFSDERSSAERLFSCLASFLFSITSCFTDFKDALYQAHHSRAPCARGNLPSNSVRSFMPLATTQKLIRPDSSISWTCITSCRFHESVASDLHEEKIVHHCNQDFESDRSIDLDALEVPSRQSSLIGNAWFSDRCERTVSQPEHTEAAEMKWSSVQPDSEEHGMFPTSTVDLSTSADTQCPLTHSLQHADLPPPSSMDQLYAFDLVGNALRDFRASRVESRKCISVIDIQLQIQVSNTVYQVSDCRLVRLLALWPWVRASGFTATLLLLFFAVSASDPSSNFTIEYQRHLLLVVRALSCLPGGTCDVFVATLPPFKLARANKCYSMFMGIAFKLNDGLQFVPRGVLAVDVRYIDPPVKNNIGEEKCVPRLLLS
uniref:Uncharacterized protein ORF31 n=1 Tax=Alternaria alternata TaxID=5599 RepID=C9K7J5_ALTAL|nr:hypothetical protein [Alternaria alternata]